MKFLAPSRNYFTGFRAAVIAAIVVDATFDHAWIIGAALIVVGRRSEVWITAACLSPAAGC